MQIRAMGIWKEIFTQGIKDKSDLERLTNSGEIAQCYYELNRVIGIIKGEFKKIEDNLPIKVELIDDEISKAFTFGLNMLKKVLSDISDQKRQVRPGVHECLLIFSGVR